MPKGEKRDVSWADLEEGLYVYFSDHLLQERYRDRWWKVTKIDREAPTQDGNPFRDPRGVPWRVWLVDRAGRTDVMFRGSGAVKIVRWVDPTEGVS